MSFRLGLVTLVFNDRKSLSILLRRMAELYPREDITLRVLAIDDGSTRRNASPDVAKADLSCICRLDILRVATTNLGHQRGNRDRTRAARRPVDVEAVQVIDSGGEECPEEIGVLVAAARANPEAVILV